MPSVNRIHDNRVEVSFPVTEQQVIITAAEHLIVYNHPDRVAAIKFLKDQYSLGLHEAKTLYDIIKAVPLWVLASKPANADLDLSYQPPQQGVLRGHTHVPKL